MPTLYVENVPKDLYEAIRGRAKRNRSSISAEVLAVLAQSVPTEEEVKRRWAILDKLKELSAMPSPAPGPFPSAEEMIREDRER